MNNTLKLDSIGNLALDAQTAWSGIEHAFEGLAAPASQALASAGNAVAGGSSASSAVAAAEQSFERAVPQAAPVVDALKAFASAGNLGSLSPADQAKAAHAIVNAITAAATVANPEAIPLVAIFNAVLNAGIQRSLAAAPQANPPVVPQPSPAVAATIHAVPAPAAILTPASAATPNSAAATTTTITSPHLPISAAAPASLAVAPTATGATISEGAAKAPADLAPPTKASGIIGKLINALTPSGETFMLGYVYLIGFFILCGIYFYGVMSPHEIDESDLQLVREILTGLLGGVGAVIANYFHRANK